MKSFTGTKTVKACKMSRKSAEEIIGRKVRVDSDEIEDEAGNESSRLKEDLRGDSLDGLDVAIELDKQFGINTSDEDLTRINAGTVSDIADIVVEHLNKKEARK